MSFTSVWVDAGRTFGFDTSWRTGGLAIDELLPITLLADYWSARVIPADYPEPIEGSSGTAIADEVDLSVGIVPGTGNPITGLPTVFVEPDELFNPVGTQGNTDTKTEWDAAVPEQDVVSVLPPGVVPMSPLDWQPGDPPIQTTTWEEYGQLAGKVGVLPPPGTSPGVRIENGIVQSGSGGETVAQDWGEFLGGLAQDYITQEVLPGPSTSTPAQVIGPMPLPAGPVGAAIGAGGAAAYNAWRAGLTLPTEKPVRKGRVWNPRTGRWVSPRRRRRRLLTEQDYADLAKLQSLTGKGQAFTVAVMKAVRR